jgi:hypothetical protein
MAEAARPEDSNSEVSGDMIADYPEISWLTHQFKYYICFLKRLNCSNETRG